MITSLCILSRASGLDDDEEMVVRAMLNADPATMRGDVATLAWGRLLDMLNWPEAATSDTPVSRDRLLIALGRLVHRTAGGGAPSERRPLPVFAVLHNESVRKMTTCQFDPLFISAMHSVAARCAIAPF